MISQPHWKSDPSFGEDIDQAPPNAVLEVAVGDPFGIFVSWFSATQQGGVANELEGDA